MATPTSIGVIELSSIGIGYLVEDEMLLAKGDTVVLLAGAEWLVRKRAGLI